MFFVGLVRKILYAAVVIGLVNVWLTRKSYLFDVNTLESIAKRHSLPATSSGSATVQEIRDSFKGIVRELRQFYGPSILNDVDLKWIKMSHGGGGAVAMCALHFSLTEYVTLIGTALPSTAHCGRSWMNVTVFPVTGSVDVWSERYSASTLKAGQSLSLLNGDTLIIQYKPGFWALEYGRGFIPSAMPHIVGGVLFLNQDPYALFFLLEAFLKSQLQQFIFAIAHWREALNV